MICSFTTPLNTHSRRSPAVWRTERKTSAERDRESSRQEIEAPDLEQRGSHRLETEKARLIQRTSVFICIKRSYEDVYICCELFCWGNDVYMYEKVLSPQSLLFKSVLALAKNKVLLSRLHYCNALLAGLPASSIKPLQLMQNVAARLIFNEPKRTHVTPLFINLHWLPIAAQCIKFKALMFAYGTTSGSAPLYLNSLLQTYVASRSLCSARERRITVPSQRDTKSLSLTFTLTVPIWWPAQLNPRVLTHLQETHLFIFI